MDGDLIHQFSKLTLFVRLQNSHLIWKNLAYFTTGSWEITAIDYKRFLCENHLDVDNRSLKAYRKGGTTQYRVTVTNKAMPRNIVDMEIQERLSDVDDGEVKSMYF